jgi:SOS-response transcriptional repressor LexA
MCRINVNPQKPIHRKIMKTITDRLFELVNEKCGGSRPEFTRRVSHVYGKPIRPNTINEWFKAKPGAKKPSQPQTDKLQAIAKAFDVDVDWITHGEGKGIEGNVSPLSEIHLIPKLDAYVGAGGEGAVLSEEIKGYIAIPMHLPEKVNIAAVFAFEISGESMAPVLCDGDEVLIDTDQNEIKPGLYVVRLPGGLVAKYIELMPSGSQVQLISKNAGFAPKVVNLDCDDFAVIGKVIGLHRTL